MFNETGANVVLQGGVVGRFVQCAGEKNRAGDSLLPVDYDEFLENSCGGLVLIDERADKVRTVALDGLGHVVEKFFAVGFFPVVVALIDGNNQRPFVRNEIVDSHNTCLH